MARRIPSRSGPAISNTARHLRAKTLAGDPGRPIPAVDEPPCNETALSQPQDAVAPAIAENADPVLTDRAPASPRAVTYYVRACGDDLRRLSELAAALATCVSYTRTALITRLRQTLLRQRAQTSWAAQSLRVTEILTAPTPHATPLMKGALTLTQDQEAELRASVRDPLGSFTTARILSAHATIAFGAALEQLRQNHRP